MSTLAKVPIYVGNQLGIIIYPIAVIEEVVIITDVGNEAILVIHPPLLCNFAIISLTYI